MTNRRTVQHRTLGADEADLDELFDTALFGAVLENMAAASASEPVSPPHVTAEPDPAPGLDIAHVRRVDPEDEKEFVVCMFHPGGPALVPRRIGLMAADNPTKGLTWADGRHVWFHQIAGTSGANPFASMLASWESDEPDSNEEPTLNGEVYLVATQPDHATMDFPEDIFDVLVHVHAEFAGDHGGGDGLDNRIDSDPSPPELNEASAT